jgi:hypothetical protein
MCDYGKGSFYLNSREQIMEEKCKIADFEFEKSWSFLAKLEFAF